MIKRNIVLLFLTVFLTFNSANASKLPDDIWKFVKSNIPQANQRFDSVIIVNDDIMYIPLTPPADTTVTAINIEYTYPANKKLNQYPEVVLLNNGYSLLKVFKDSKGNYTLTSKDDLPIKVRLGLMPQDMLTPAGLKMPESLKLTLGDLLIPSKEDTSLGLKNNGKEKQKNSYAPVVKRDEFMPSVEFKNKKTFINPKNSKFLEVFDNTSASPLYELKLSSLPMKILTFDEAKVAVVLYWNGKNVEIIDLKDERMIKSIQLDANASDMVIDKKSGDVYISSQNANSIYIISLSTMEIKKVIKLGQNPTIITYNDVDDSISFFDELSSKVYNITKTTNEYLVQPVGKAQNITSILSDVANIYAISRIDNQLYIYDKTEGKLINTIELDKKPTDAIYYHSNIYILCSKEGYLDVYDTTNGKLVSRQQLSKDGFYSKITLIPSENNILITGIKSKNYLLYNLDKMKLIKAQESYIDVANIAITSKNNRL